MLGWRMPQRVQEDEMRKRKKSAEQSSEVSSQPGEATACLFKCDTCQRAFRHRQDIARHRCAPVALKVK